jgi:hypothetical protein
MARSRGGFVSENHVLRAVCFRTARNLRCQHLELVHLRLFREQLPRFPKQRLCDFAVQVCFASVLVSKCVENSEFRSAKPYRVPRDRPGSCSASASADSRKQYLNVSISLPFYVSVATSIRR